MVKQFSQNLKKEFLGYNRGKLIKDLLAGITVAAVALPLALAFGVSSGATAAAGLITAILAGLMIGALSGASYQISGPTGAMSAILASIVVKYGLQGVFLATLMAGIILVLAGVFKLGRLVSIIPTPVITGFTSGIAIIIALGQIDHFFGTSSSGETVLQRLASYRSLGFSPQWQTVVIGMAVVLIMVFWPRKWQSVLPSSLSALIVVTALNELLLHWQVTSVGEIPRTLLPATRLLPSEIVASDLYGLLIPACSIAALGMIESLLCGASAGRMKHEIMDPDQELLAQGVGNILLPFFGGVPATAAIARTSVAIKAGQQTRLTGIFHALSLLVFMFLLAPLMSRIPMAALAGILIVTAWRMNDWTTIRYYFSRKLKSACVGVLLTMAVTVVFDLSAAIVAGISFSAIMFAVKASGQANVTVSKIDPNRLSSTKISYKKSFDHVVVAYITGSLFFGNINRVMATLKKIEAPVNTLIFSLRGLAAIDTTSVQYLQEFCTELQDQGIKLYVVGAQKQVLRYLGRGGLVEQIGPECFFWSAEHALELIAKQELS